MSETITETSLRASLKEHMQAWLTEVHSNDPICYISDNASSAMADAAFAVLQGMADLEQWFKDEGYME